MKMYLYAYIHTYIHTYHCIDAYGKRMDIWIYAMNKGPYQKVLRNVKSCYATLCLSMSIESTKARVARMSLEHEYDI